MQHPLALDTAVPSQLLDTRRAAMLERDEARLKAGMSKDVANAVKGKRILLFKEILVATAFPDLGVVDDLHCGSDLTGEVPPTGMLPGKFGPAIISDQELLANAERTRDVAVSAVKSSGDPDIDRILFGLKLWRRLSVDGFWVLLRRIQSVLIGRSPEDLA